MAKKSSRNRKKQNLKCLERRDCCESCGHCLYIGEGDFICDAGDRPVMVISDFMPMPKYRYCDGREWEE